MHLGIYQAVDISSIHKKGDEIMQVLSARPYFEHKTPETVPGLGAGCFALERLTATLLLKTMY